MNLVKLFIFFISAFLLTACVPKFDKQSMIKKEKITQELQRDMNASRYTKGELSQKWWQVYGDKQLDDILQKALTTAPTLKVVEARYSHANSVIDSIKSNNLPQVSIGGSAARERYSANYIFPPPLGGGTVSLFELHTQLHYEFDFWHKRRSKILAAKYGAMAQNVYIDEMKLLLASGITRLYMAWNYEVQSIATLQSLQKVALHVRKIFALQKENGLVSGSAVYNADAQIAAIAQQIQAHKRAIEGLKESIAILGGFLPSYMNALHPPKIKKSVTMPLPKKVYLNLLAHRPDIAVQKYIVMSYNEKIKEAKARFYPNINLAALVGYTTFDLGKFIDYSSFAPMAGAAFSLPLFDNGARKANLMMQVSQYDSAVYAYNALVIKAANETVSLLQKQVSVENQVKALDNELQARENNYKVTANRFRAGLTNALGMFAIKTQLLHNKLAYIQLENEKALLQINLIKALGGGYANREPHATK